MKNHWLPVSLLAALFAALSFSPASAHADLARSNPESNAVLDRSPGLVEIYFSEPVEASFSTIQVLNVEGKRVDNDDARLDLLDPTHLLVTIRSLPDGIYTVSWKALSSVDSHVTAGAYPFAVGNVEAAALASAAAASRQVKLSAGEILVRWLTYLSVAALSGGILFNQLIWRPVAATVHESADLQTPWRPLFSAGLGLAIIAASLGLLVQTGQAAGVEIVAPWDADIFTILVSTRFGSFWLVRVCLFFLIAWLVLGPESPTRQWFALAGVFLIQATISLGSHAAAEPRPFFPVLADWLHLAASSIWVGGLIFFLAGLWAIRLQPAELRVLLSSRLIPRFSTLAITSVAILGVSGIYSAYLRVGSWAALVDALYGRVLTVKTLLVLPLLGIAAINLLNTSPAMRRAAKENAGRGELVERFRLLVSGEVIFSSLVLLVAGIFTAIPPVRAAATTAAWRESVEIDDLQMAFSITPGGVGLNTFDITLSSDGEPVELTREVLLRFLPTSLDLPPSEVALEHQGGGLYQTRGVFLSLPDTWQVQAIVRRDGHFDAFANFELSVGAAQTRTTWNRYAGILLAIAALTYWLAAGRLHLSRAMIWTTARVPVVVLLLSAILVFRFQPPTDEPRFVNPIPPNSDSVTLGRELYLQNCLPCHGPSGKGDGPVGLTLNPRPADLTVHTAPGVHPDGRLYEWITFGFADNQVMPRFETLLSDEDRWHIVNYIRTFGTTSP